MALQEISFKDPSALYGIKNNISKNEQLPKFLKISFVALTILGLALLPSAFITFATIKGMSIIILPTNWKFIAGYFLCSTAAAGAVLAYLTAQKQKTKETADDTSTSQSQNPITPALRFNLKKSDPLLSSYAQVREEPVKFIEKPNPLIISKIGDNELSFNLTSNDTDPLIIAYKKAHGITT